MPRGARCRAVRNSPDVGGEGRVGRPAGRLRPPGPQAHTRHALVDPVQLIPTAALLLVGALLSGAPRPVRALSLAEAPAAGDPAFAALARDPCRRARSPRRSPGFDADGVLRTHYVLVDALGREIARFAIPGGVGRRRALDRRRHARVRRRRDGRGRARGLALRVTVADVDDAVVRIAPASRWPHRRAARRGGADRDLAQPRPGRRHARARHARHRARRALRRDAGRLAGHVPGTVRARRRAGRVVVRRGHRVPHPATGPARRAPGPQRHGEGVDRRRRLERRRSVHERPALPRPLPVGGDRWPNGAPADARVAQPRGLPGRRRRGADARRLVRRLEHARVVRAARVRGADQRRGRTPRGGRPARGRRAQHGALADDAGRTRRASSPSPGRSSTR